MIEIIYKNDNVENKQNTTLKLPKNIRQIGHGDSDYQIYIEDYLMNYLKKRPEREGDIRYGVLLGDVKIGNGYTYFFINGAVDVDEVLENTIIFNDDIWTSLYEDINTYFVGNRIIGWFASLNDSSNNDMLNIKKLHLDNFAGNDKVFLRLDMNEDEENFFVYENTGLTKQPCYHIYYNKSEYMEDYIYGTGKRDRYKKAEIKNRDTGKYGILLNNINEKRNNESIIEEKINESAEEPSVMTGEFIAKLGKNMKLSRVAGVILAVTMAAGLGTMYKEGKLNDVQQTISNFASGIAGSDEAKKPENIISVNGVVGERATSEKPTEVESETETKVEVESELETKNESENETETTVAVAGNTTDTYIVKAGDTLLSICVDYYNDKSKIDEVIEANNITNPDIVIPGEELIMP